MASWSQEVVQRFEDKYDNVPDENGCWNWYKPDPGDNYGRFHWNHGSRLAHKIAYCIANRVEWQHLDGLEIRHSCHNKSCVNPAHLQPGSREENIEDSVLGDEPHKAWYTLDFIREVFDLVVVAGYSQQEVSVMLGTSKGNISDWIHGKTTRSAIVRKEYEHLM